MIKKIAYENKVAIQNDEDVENKNKVTDDDMNEIKEVVNNNADELTEAQENISDIQEEQETQNTKISTLETDNTTNKADISDIKTKNNEQDTNIEELQENLSDAQQEIEALKTIQNALPTIDGEGENLTLKGTAENTTFKKFGICGNSRQETREGYNLIDIVNSSLMGQDKGVTIEISDDGYITANGTPTTSYTVFISKNVTNLLEDGQTYSLWQENYSDKANGGIFSQITASPKPGSSVTAKFINAAMSRNTFTVDKTNFTYMWIVQSGPISATGTFTNYRNRYMLYKGTDNKEKFELYGAMPSPNFSSKIEVVGDDTNQFNKDEVVLKDGYYSSTDNGNFVQSNTTCHTENFIKVIPNTNYILSRFKRHSSSYNYPSVYAIYFYDNEKNWISRTSAFYTSNSAPINEYLEYQFKTPSNCRYIRFQCQTTEINLDLDTIELKLEEYIGTASVEKCNKNIIDLLSEGLTSGGWHTGSTYNENNVKVLKSPYNSGKNWNSFYFLNEKIVGKNVSISFDIKVNNLEYISLLSLQNTASYGSGTIEGIKKFITKNDTYVHVKINNYLVTTNMLAFFVQSSYVEGTESDSIYVYIKNFQVEENSVATDYVEHQEQNFTMPVQKEMLEEDYFDLDTFEEVHGWKKLVLDGSENWLQSSLNTEGFNNFYIQKILEGYVNAEDDIEMKLSHFVQKPFSNWTGLLLEEFAENSSGNLGIRISQDIAENLESFKTWLSSNNVTVYYRAKTEERLPMTAEQIEIAKQIKNTLVSYKDTTHVYSEDNISPIFKCSAIADMTAMLDNLQAQILAEEV